MLKKSLQVELASKIKGQANLYEYKKGIIEFWNESEMRSLIESPEKMSAYWQTLFDIKLKEKHNGIPIRKMCMFTKKPLPKIPRLACDFENLSFQTNTRTASNPVYFKEVDTQLLLDYTLAIIEKLVNKSFTCHLDKSPYFIVPLETKLEDSVFQEKVDWEEIKRTVANNMKQDFSKDQSDLKDTIVFEPTNKHKLYFIKNNEGYEIKEEESGFSIKDKATLDLSKCRVFPTSASVYQAIHMLPKVLQQIDEFLLIKQFKNRNGLFIDDALLLEAITSPSANKQKDYERLEFLGDSILKFVTSAYLYAKYPEYQEGELSESRTRIICNSSLASLAKDISVQEYVICQSIPRRFWRPPNFKCGFDSEKIKLWLKYHLISDNTLADVIEALLGAGFMSGSLDSAISVIRKLKFPLEIENWSDIQHTYKNTPRNKGAQWTVDVVRVAEILGFEFKDYTLVQEALVHRSASPKTYERLEFLGDALLDYYVTCYIYKKYPTAAPAILHDLRKSSVNHHILSVICLKMKLHKHIVYSAASIATAVMKFEDSHEKIVSSGGNIDEYWLRFDSPKMLSDVMESLMGAMLVDSEFDVSRVGEFFDRWIKPILERHISLDTMTVHPMTLLNQKIQDLGCREWETR